jgi:hypothetical protein
VESLLPDSFEALEIVADVLPLGEVLRVHPFTRFVINFNVTRFVINFNVTTLVHRDAKDKEICVVFQISECTGGELCLVEPGLKIQLHNGDGVIFPSHKISHFNCHFVRERMSLVFHTDRSMDDWAANCNNWEHNIYFRSTRLRTFDPNDAVEDTI